MSKLTTKNSIQAKPFQPKVYPGKGEVKAEISTMTEVGSKPEIDKKQR